MSCKGVSTHLLDTRNVKILVVTVTGNGDNPKNTQAFESFQIANLLHFLTLSH